MIYVEGLSGCRNLQVLTVHGHSCITAESAEHTLSLLSHCHIPDNISKLSALTELVLDIMPNADPADTPWLYQLTGLQSLQLQLFGDAAMYLGTELAALSNLRALYVSLNEMGVDQCFVYVNTKWELMHSLQHVTFKGRAGSFCFWTATLNLVNAPNLRSLSFGQWQLTHIDPSEVQLFELVVHELTLKRPDVRVLIFESQPVQRGQW
jgi:hypothetical protein